MVTVAGTSRSSALCATRATARTWLSRRCAAVRSAELATANAASSTGTLRCETSIPSPPGPGRPRLSPRPSSSAQPASPAVLNGGSTKEASSGPTDSHAMGMSPRPAVYCATAAPVMASSSISATTRLARPPDGWAGPDASSAMPRPVCNTDRPTHRHALTSGRRGPDTQPQWPLPETMPLPALNFAVPLIRAALQLSGILGSGRTTPQSEMGLSTR